MSRVLIGNRRVSLEEFANVVEQGYDVVLDEGVLRRIVEQVSEPAKSSLRVAALKTQGAQADRIEQRANLLALLVRLMQGRSEVRACVIEKLAVMLNDREASAASGALSSRVGLPLTAAEISMLDSPCRTGVAAVYVFQICQLSIAADVAAAVSLEAVRCPVEPFSISRHDEARPHPGQVAVAGNIRRLMKGTATVAPAVGGTYAKINECFLQIPEIHGSSHEIVPLIEKSMEIELNCSDPDVASVQVCSRPLETIVKRARSAAAPLISAAVDRCSELINMLDQSITAPAVKSLSVLNAGVPAGKDIESYLRDLIESSSKLRQAIASEMFCALNILTKRCADARTAFDESETARKERMSVERADAIAKSNAAPVDKKLANRVANLVFKPREFNANIASGAAGCIGQFGNELSNLQQFIETFNVFSPNVRSFFSVLLTATNQFRKPKVPKGTRDFGKDEMLIRENVFSTIKSVFQRHGAVGIDTPVFELRETLMGKYGEDSKLIYDLADQGGEKLSLRYDLTVPFARYLASNKIRSIKRYHIARVYRRDNPAMNRGRFREFYQCDFDIAGVFDSMMPDAEVLSVLVEILKNLDFRFVVKFNHRRLLDAIMDVCNVPAEKFRTICSAIDKLDKESWEQVREEMMEKGLSGAAADQLGFYVGQKGTPMQMLEMLRSLPQISEHKEASATLDDLDTLFGYLTALGVLEYISFDLSLARGLDYYTGVIYEAVLMETDQFGSIAAGGRYDNLVGMFLPSGEQVPAVGVSIGIERVFAIIEARERSKVGGIQKTRTQVLVASIGDSLTNERMKVCSELWSAGIAAEFIQKKSPKFQKQLEFALDLQIPFIVLVGETEIANGNVKIKDVVNSIEDTLPRSQMISFLKSKLQK